MTDPLQITGAHDVRQLIQTLNRQHRLIAERLDSLEGVNGRTPAIAADSVFSGKRLTNVGRSQVDDDALTRGELREILGTWDEGEAIVIDRPVVLQGGARVGKSTKTKDDIITQSEVVTQITIAFRSAAADAAPPKVGDASVLGVVTTQFALEDHTHQGVNLDAAQTITGTKLFNTGGAPFQVGSTTKVVNLNADLLDGLEGSAFLLVGAAAGGDLSGTYPNPAVVDDSHNHTIATLSGVQPLDADLTALAALSATGLLARTGAATYALRTLTGPAAGIGVSNGDGVAGNPTLSLANDLAALEGLGATGIAVRSAADTWVQRSLAVTDSSTIDFTLTNADGVSGNPTITGSVIPGGIDHGALAGLSDDDHTDYTRKTGRSGTGNDTTLSTSGDGTLVGSSNAGSSLLLAGSSADDAGFVNAQHRLRLIDKSGISLASTTTPLIEVLRNGLTVTGSGNVLEGLRVGGTIEAAGDFNPFTAAALFNFNTVIQNNPSGTPRFFGLFYALAAQPTIRAQNATLAGFGDVYGMVYQPIWDRVTAGGGTISNAAGVLINSVNVGVGWTATQLSGLRMQNPIVGGTITTLCGIDLNGLAAGGTNISLRSTGNAELRHQGAALFGNSGGPATGDGRVLEIERTFTLTGALSDGYAAALTLDPGYTAATAQTVTRHNYIDAQDVSVAGAGPAAVTDACLVRFDAAVGTHKVLASPGAVAVTLGTGPTGANAGNPLGWVKINVNGAVRFMPFW